MRKVYGTDEVVSISGWIINEIKWKVLLLIGLSWKQEVSSSTEPEQYLLKGNYKIC